MMGLGVSFLESIGTVISSMGNMGPGLGTCGPAFHGVNCLMPPNGCFLFNALGTFGIVYSITTFHFRFLEKELRIQ